MSPVHAVQLYNYCTPTQLYVCMYIFTYMYICIYMYNVCFLVTYMYMYMYYVYVICVNLRFCRHVCSAHPLTSKSCKNKGMCIIVTINSWFCFSYLRVLPSHPLFSLSLHAYTGGAHLHRSSRWRIGWSHADMRPGGEKMGSPHSGPLH